MDPATIAVIVTGAVAVITIFTKATVTLIKRKHTKHKKARAELELSDLSSVSSLTASGRASPTENEIEERKIRTLRKILMKQERKRKNDLLKS